jgi:hypothetical protein
MTRISVLMTAIRDRGLDQNRKTDDNAIVEHVEIGDTCALLSYITLGFTGNEQIRNFRSTVYNVLNDWVEFQQTTFVLGNIIGQGGFSG